jgi:hypothetical protein
MLIVRGMERRQDYRPAECVHDAETAAAPLRLPSTVVNGGQRCRRTVESDNHRRDNQGRTHRETSVTASVPSERPLDLSAVDVSARPVWPLAAVSEPTGGWPAAVARSGAGRCEEERMMIPSW